VKRLLGWIFGLPAAILLVGFAVANRRWVDVSLDPFDQNNPALYLHLPLWLVLVLGMFVGLVTGWIAAWINQGRWRRHARQVRHDNERLRMEMSQLRAEIEERNTAGIKQDANLIGTI
jgi:uncharacterized integral membrane protein